MGWDMELVTLGVALEWPWGRDQQCWLLGQLRARTCTHFISYKTSLCCTFSSQTELVDQDGAGHSLKNFLIFF